MQEIHLMTKLVQHAKRCGSSESKIFNFLFQCASEIHHKTHTLQTDTRICRGNLKPFQTFSEIKAWTVSENWLQKYLTSPEKSASKQNCCGSAQRNNKKMCVCWSTSTRYLSLVSTVSILSSIWLNKEACKQRFIHKEAGHQFLTKAPNGSEVSNKSLFFSFFSWDIH